MVQTATRRHSPNVGASERIGSTLVGMLLIDRALRKPRPLRIAGAMLGVDLLYRGVTGECSLYRTLGVSTARPSRPGSELAGDALQVRRSITIDAPPEELAKFWRDTEKLSRVVANFATVTPGSDGIAHWRLRGPMNQNMEWDSRQIDQDGGRSIAWSSLPGSQLPNRGHIEFRPGPDGAGTEVELEMRFEPPLGQLGLGVARRLHKLPRATVGQTLRRFKSLVETGEIPTLQRNPSGRGSSDSF